MCKYCKLEPTGVPGEESNNVTNIGFFNDGSEQIGISFYRYIDRENNHRVNELILDKTVALVDGHHPVKERHINIKYCPFCGEKLL